MLQCLLARRHLERRSSGHGRERLLIAVLLESRVGQELDEEGEAALEGDRDAADEAEHGADDLVQLEVHLGDVAARRRRARVIVLCIIALHSKVLQEAGLHDLLEGARRDRDAVVLLPRGVTHRLEAVLVEVVLPTRLLAAERGEEALGVLLAPHRRTRRLAAVALRRLRDLAERALAGAVITARPDGHPVLQLPRPRRPAHRAVGGRVKLRQPPAVVVVRHHSLHRHRQHRLQQRALLLRVRVPAHRVRRDGDLAVEREEAVARDIRARDVALLEDPGPAVAAHSDGADGVVAEVAAVRRRLLLAAAERHGRHGALDAVRRLDHVERRQHAKQRRPPRALRSGSDLVEKRLRLDQVRRDDGPRAQVEHRVLDGDVARIAHLDDPEEDGEADLRWHAVAVGHGRIVQAANRDDLGVIAHLVQRVVDVGERSEGDVGVAARARRVEVHDLLVPIPADEDAPLHALHRLALHLNQPRLLLEHMIRQQRRRRQQHQEHVQDRRALGALLRHRVLVLVHDSLQNDMTEKTRPALGGRLHPPNAHGWVAMRTPTPSKH
mmetsp:Transcript_5269/g.18909  ORF Transcript_5269/g.18909 Transcript_5269/m.18909 type:complete len:553 (+) Transcript_5269:224-1882(+)